MFKKIILIWVGLINQVISNNRTRVIRSGFLYILLGKNPPF